MTDQQIKSKAESITRIIKEIVREKPTAQNAYGLKLWARVEEALIGAFASTEAAAGEPIYQAYVDCVACFTDVRKDAYDSTSPDKRRIVYTAPPAASGQKLLAEDHKGMRVDYSGMFKQARGALVRGMKEPALAEMLRQLQEHITELGTRWYAGDTAVVDELLQLYCVNKATRDALRASSATASDKEA